MSTRLEKILQLYVKKTKQSITKGFPTITTLFDGIKFLFYSTDLH